MAGSSHDSGFFGTGKVKKGKGEEWWWWWWRKKQHIPYEMHLLETRSTLRNQANLRGEFGNWPSVITAK